MLVVRSEKELFKNVFVEKNAKRIRNYLKGLVLDVGCSDGFLTYVHEPTIGVDAVPNSCPFPLVLADMHALPFKDSTFNVVVMNHVCEHSATPSLALKEIRRILVRGGILAITVPNAKTWISSLLTRVLGYDGYAVQKDSDKQPFGHKSYFGFEDLKNVLESSGFAIDAYYGSTPAFPVIDRLFNFKPLRGLYWRLGDVDIKHAKDLLFVGEKR
jgi:SAM-dependent methyltransferase